MGMCVLTEAGKRKKGSSRFAGQQPERQRQQSHGAARKCFHQDRCVLVIRLGWEILKMNTHTRERSTTSSDQLKRNVCLRQLHGKRVII